MASLGSGSLTWFTVPHAGRVGSLATALARTHHVLHQPCQAKLCVDSTAATACLSFSFSICISSFLKNTRTLPEEFQNQEWEMSNGRIYLFKSLQFRLFIKNICKTRLNTQTSLWLYCHDIQQWEKFKNGQWERKTKVSLWLSSYLLCLMHWDKTFYNRPFSPSNSRWGAS